MFITSKLKSLVDELYSFHEFLFNTIEALQNSSDLSTLDIYQISEYSLLADDANHLNEIIQMVLHGDLTPRRAKEEFQKADSVICKLYNQLFIIQ